MATEVSGSEVLVSEGKKGRQAKPTWVPEDGFQKISCPDGFDPEVHATGWTTEDYRPLPGKLFAGRDSFFLYRAYLCDLKAAKFRKEAGEWKIHGPAKKTARKLEAMKRKMADLQASLAEMGISEEEIAKLSG